MKRALSRFGAPSVRGLDCFDPSPLGHQRTRPRAAGAHRSLTKYSGRWCRDHPTTDCRESRGAHLPSELACRKQVSTSLSAPQSYHTEECRRHAVAAGSAPLSPLGQKFSLWSSSGSEAQGQRLRQCETQVWLARWFLVPASRAQPLPLGRPLWWQWPGWKAIVRSLPCPGVAYTMQNRGMRGRLKYLPALVPHAFGLATPARAPCAMAITASLCRSLTSITLRDCHGDDCIGTSFCGALACPADALS